MILRRTTYEASAGDTAIKATPRMADFRASRKSTIRYYAGVVSRPEHRVLCPVCEYRNSRAERIVAGFALERCGRCSHVFMNPQYGESEVAELYVDRNADELAAIYSRITAAQSVRGRYISKLEMLETALPGRGRLLDFACGYGGFFEIAQTRGWDAHGSEIGQWAQRVAAARDLKNLHIGTLGDLHFPDAWFDVVHAAQVFEHLAKPKNELAEIRRILRPGGLLYIDVPNYRTLSIVLGRDDFMLNEPPQHLNYFSPKTLRSLLQASGFVVERVASNGGLKWENLVGRKINSDIAQAYGLVSDSRQKGRGTAGRRLTSALKNLLLTMFVEPILYERLKVGMVLFAVARR